jgi:[ribosomal protein S5]-alanine N-acetyltransferase
MRHATSASNATCGFLRGEVFGGGRLGSTWRWRRVAGSTRRLGPSAEGAADGMVDAMTPAASVLETTRFCLTPLAETDRCDLYAHLADPATVEHMDIEPLSDPDGADTIIAWAMRLLAAGQGVRWAIRDDAGAFVGTAGFNALIRERASRGELAYDVVRARWRQGVMAEVMPAILAHGYDDVGLRRIEALVTPGNRASAALLERFRFSCEATLRDYAFCKGRFWDQWLYARLADHY